MNRRINPHFPHQFNSPPGGVEVEFRHAYHEHAYYSEVAPLTPRPDPDRSVGFLINDVARLLRRNFNRRVQTLGLTQAQWRAVVHLSRNEGMTQVALADCLEIQPITLTRLIDRMEAAGWVERRNHPLDRRAVQLYLTSKSEPILEEMHARAADTVAMAVAGMPAAGQKQLIEDLQHMKRNLAAAETAAAGETESIGRTNHVGRKPSKLQRTR
ncbi:MAG TPA: MarR family transcriptional regulator [Gammaproteobacteria bacterium]|nr:MarR family transcriptional regulator [Gammaproteobacteria bacterium]